MSPRLYLSALFLAFFSLWSAAQESGYYFRINLSEYADEELIVARYLGKSILVHGKITLDPEGNGEYASIDREGIYLLVFPDSSRYEIMVSGEGTYEIYQEDKHLELRSNPGSEAFAFFNTKNKQAVDLLDSLQRNNSEAGRSGNRDTRSISRELRNELDSLVHAYAKTFSGNFAGTYFKALLPMKMPPMTNDSTLSDSLRWMLRIRYYRDHYLDNINFNEPAMLYTPVIELSIHQYLGKIVPQSIVGQDEAIDLILQKSSVKEIDEFLLKQLFTYYHSKLSDPVAEHAYLYLAEKYLLPGNPAWLQSKMRKKIEDEVNFLAPASLGRIAPEIALKDENGKIISLHELEGEAILILFWDYACPSCRKIIDEFRVVLAKYFYKDIEVYTVFTGDDPEIWKAWVARNLGSDWHNTLLSGREDILKAYAIVHTPTLFILNKNHEITEKGLTVRELDNYLFELPY